MASADKRARQREERTTLRVRRVSRRLIVLGVLLALCAPALPAQAATGDSVHANAALVVTHSTSLCAGSNPLPSVIPSGPGHVWIFSDVSIVGTWVAGTTPFAGAIGMSELVGCASAVGSPPPPVPALVTQGSLGGATYSSTSNIVGNLTNGVLVFGGQFIQVGLQALVAIDTSYTVSGTASGAVSLVANMRVAPVGSAGVGTQDTWVGSVDS
jgi:hypothetical protein